ncbi:MAG: molybdopterin oxidoreductase family protein [Solirubrobacterales bacterium]|nr:molybdopterin oxidoreductase family protein [Solirubrobacterales bacterium]
MSAERVVHAACPHDCPDTCAMLVTVNGEGRAVQVAGDPDQPVTHGFLCGKVSNYLERVYSPERLLHPLIRTGAKGAGEFRQASWDDALELVAGTLRRVIERHGGEAILPYSYFGTQGFLQADLMSARVMNALGATSLERTICATGGIFGTVATQGSSPEVDPELWPRCKLIVCWGWNPLSTAPHLWRLILAARRDGARLVVVDPFRSRTARVADEHIRPLPGTDAALALGAMRAMLDAGLVDEEWCRAYATGYDELRGRLEAEPVEHWASLCGVPPEQVTRLGRELAIQQPSLVRLGVGAQRHAGAEIAYRTIACLPALAGSWRHVGGGLSYIPTAIAGAVDSSTLKRSDLRPGPVRTINMAALGGALTDAGLEPPVAALVVWCSNPAQVAPDASVVRRGLSRLDLFTVVLEQFMTDTARYADVVLPATTQLEHLDALFSWGHHYLTWNEPAIAPRGEAKPNSEIFRLLAARLGLQDACFSESDEQMLAALFASEPGGVTLEELRGKGWAKIDLGQGMAPHAEGRFGTADGRLALRCDRLAERDVDPLPHYAPPAEVADAELSSQFPLALLTPKTHLFLNSTFANQARQASAQPQPYVVVHPDDAAPRGIQDGALVRVFNDRGACVLPARVSNDARPGVVVAPMGWWGQPGAQATTSQRLTRLAHAPTFNDNRVELARAR